MNMKNNKLTKIAEGKCLNWLCDCVLIGDTLITNIDFDKYEEKDIILYVEEK